MNHSAISRPERTTLAALPRHEIMANMQKRIGHMNAEEQDGALQRICWPAVKSVTRFASMEKISG
jgi:2-oxo-4-hydroxy-4-carboxy--5-ureidoimidazoline (OHCU) decarboxylase